MPTSKLSNNNQESSAAESDCSDTSSPLSIIRAEFDHNIIPSARLSRGGRLRIFMHRIKVLDTPQFGIELLV
jgi:hypothetical protein